MSLTPKQMRDMYGSKRKSPSKSNSSLGNESDQALKISEATDVMLVEVDGKRHQVPTFAAYKKLLRENQQMRNDLQRALRDVAKLKEVIKLVGRNVDYVENELKNKIDKP